MPVGKRDILKSTKEPLRMGFFVLL